MSSVFSNIIETINLFTSSTLYDVTVFIIAILSFFGMIFFYYKSKKEKKPYYTIRSTNIFHDLNDKYRKLKITYDDEPINTFTLSRIYFWNGGKETIKKDDIVKNEPLSIKIKEGYQILDIKMDSLHENDFEHTDSKDGTSFVFTFDHIEKNQGVIFQILHTGKSNKDIELLGKIIGAGKPVYAFNIQTKQVPSFVSSRISNQQHLKKVNSILRTINTYYNIGTFLLIIVLLVFLELLTISILIATSHLLVKIIMFVLLLASVGFMLFLVYTIYVILTKNTPEIFDLLGCDDSFE